MELENLGASTRSVHAGESPDPLTGSLTPPLYQSSVYAFRDAAQGADLFAGRGEGYIYTRLGNPTLKTLERKLALLEGADDAVVTSSGMAAIATATAALARAGDHVVSAEVIYGATYTLFHDVWSRFGLETSFVNSTDPDEYRKAIRKNTRIIFIETPSNPTMEVIDIAALAEIARESGACLMVDNTFATPINQNPLALGAHLVAHSASKYLGGHADVIAGAVAGSATLIKEVRQNLKVLGTVLGPFEGWLILRGLKTLALRVARHNENGLAVARFLEGRPEVSRVFYPGLKSHPGHETAARQMRGFGGMLSFELKGGHDSGIRLVNSVRLCTLAVSLGDVCSLIEHPASMTHAGVPLEERLRGGISDGLVRLSVGIEDAPDIIADLGQALDRAS